MNTTLWNLKRSWHPKPLPSLSPILDQRLDLAELGLLELEGPVGVLIAGLHDEALAALGLQRLIGRLQLGREERDLLLLQDGQGTRQHEVPGRDQRASEVALEGLVDVGILHLLGAQVLARELKRPHLEHVGEGVDQQLALHPRVGLGEEALVGLGDGVGVARQHLAVEGGRVRRGVFALGGSRRGRGRF